MSCDVGKAAKGLENELCSRWSDVRVGEWGSAALPTSQLIIKPFCCFTYVTARSTTVPLLHLRHRHFSSFSNPSTALPTSQLVLQPFRCFTYVIGTSPTSPGKPPMPLWLCLISPRWFCNLQWLRPAGLHERCKMALELKRLKTPALQYSHNAQAMTIFLYHCCGLGVTSLSFAEWARVQSLVGSLLWLRFFPQL